MMKVHIKNLGCKANTFDGHAIAGRFVRAGFVMTEDPALAKIIVINSCAVTQNAGKEALYFVRRYRRNAPDSLIILAGCLSQIEETSLKEKNEIDLVVPNTQKSDLVRLAIEKLELGTQQKQEYLARASRDNLSTDGDVFFDQSLSLRTRAFVKVQDGCDSFCSYCIVPYSRGRSLSVPRGLIVDEIKRLVGQNIGEIVLTGIHIGNYGKDFGGDFNPTSAGKGLLGLLEEILKVDGLKRLRLSSLEINEVSRDLLELLSKNKEVFCDHFHLPLQSGSDRVLKMMKRIYSAGTFQECVALVRTFFSEANIGTDVIVGFPGETEKDFNETMAVLESAEIGYAHVFPYSKRPGTEASKLPQDVKQADLKGRAEILRHMSREMHQKYARCFLGRSFPVLWEQDVDDEGRRLGKTRNYLTVAGEASVHVPRRTTSRLMAGSETQIKLEKMLQHDVILGYFD